DPSVGRAAADENVRAVVLTSAVPRRFSAGLDLPPASITASIAQNLKTLANCLWRPPLNEHVAFVV
ncbi:MAG: hypothetical protein E6G80_18925, partial [Alphaproteobacteria bacterium]